VEKVR